MPVAELARILGIGVRRVQQITAQGGAVKSAARGQYDLAASVQAYVRYREDEAVAARIGSAADDEIGGRDVVDLTQERARKMRGDADIVEMQAARERGTLVRADTVGRAWSNILKIVQVKLMGQGPARIAARALGCQTEREIKQIVRDEMRQVLTEAAQIDPAEVLAADEDEVADDGGAA